MSTFNFNDPYAINIIRHFNTSADEKMPFSNQLTREEAEFEVAKSLDDEILPEDHIAFVEAIQKLSETLISCTVGIFETREDDNKIASIGLVKMLSQLFLVGHQACEDRLKFKWTKDGTKEMEEKMQAYKSLSDAILLQPEQLQEVPQPFVPGETLEMTVSVNDVAVKQEEPEVIELSDDDEKPVVPVKRKRSKPSIKICVPSKPLNSVTEGCQNEDEAPDLFPIISQLLSNPVKNLQQTCITYRDGLTVGYSDAGKKPILIVTDPSDDENVFTYRCMIRGSYRCSSCGLLNVHRYAKLYQGILYSNVHECKGKSRAIVEQEQRLRARRFNHAPLPSLSELSTAEDPRPYPAYPKTRPVTRPQNPNHWDDLIEYANFEPCFTNRAGVNGYVAYDHFDQTVCYEYCPSSKGSYRCSTCMKFRKHTIAKIDEQRNVLQSATHICHGITIVDFENAQAQRRQWNSPATNVIEIDDFDY